MKNTGYFKGKKITIVGLARSGLACANLLFDLGAQVSVTDIQDNDSTRSFAAKLKSGNIEVELGKHTEGLVEGRDIVIISPGVPDTSKPVTWSRNYKIPVLSEIEIGAILCPAPIIAVTGSNGKTTVTTLIGKIIEAAGKNAFVCGNIGKPFCGEVGKVKSGDYVCLEVSSFQLENINSFKPKVALVLNLSRNHLDRYRDMQEYAAAKKRIFMNQDKEDFLVLNGEDALLRDWENQTKAKTSFFSRQNKLTANQEAVITVGSILGIDKNVCLQVFSEFKGIEHRFEFVKEITGVKFINDSKATTVESCKMALENLACPVILIAGGRHKGVDYGILLQEARKKVKEVILIGEAKAQIRDAFGKELTLDEAGTLEEAVIKAYKKACAGDCVLLSPMCSSYDMFSDYEERGKAFKKAVNGLLEGKNKCCVKSG